ncbi:MAG: hypothetical protein WA924_00285, partial [Burkholderiaceae bacterium]
MRERFRSTPFRPLRLLQWLLAVLALAALTRADAAPGDDKAQTVVHMLDYIGVDYPGFVRGGQVLDQSEYEEQLEFATQSAALLQLLPAQPEQPALLEQARALRAAIAAKADGATVSA